MPLYLVSLEAEIHVQVEADNQAAAMDLAVHGFRWTDVEVIGPLDIECLNDNEEDDEVT